MTKEEVENIVKKYCYIIPAIKGGLNQAVFYIGKRKQVIDITGEVKLICELVDIIHDKEQDIWIRQMIRGIKLGETDIYIMQGLPYEKNAYYDRKEAFIEKIYNCCISLNLVSLEEILNEEIA